MRSKEPTTCVALGAPVPLEMLGASIETYINKAAMNTIWFCLRRLPVELIYNIVEDIQSEYEEHLEWWQAANKCCQNTCRCSDGSGQHIIRVEIMMAKLGQRQRSYRTGFSGILFRKSQQV